MFALFSRIHDTLAPKRTLVLVATLTLVGLCGLRFSGLVIREDIRTMLPDDSTRVAADFALLGHAPFTRRLTITISSPDGDPTEVAAGLCETLQGDIFPRVISGPPRETSPNLLARLPDLAPGLLNAEDMDQLSKRITPDGIRAALEKDFRTLVSPAGTALKQAIARDPLEIRNLLFPKLTKAAGLVNVRIRNGHFVSRDGKHALVMADTDIPMTDSLGAARVMARCEAALQSLPPGTSAMIVGGHRHSLANARTIKGDLNIILPASLAFLGVLFAVFMRTRQSLYVLSVPVCTLCIAATATTAVYGSVSGIIIGFGAVLLGISVDFALHVFYALRFSRLEPGPVLAGVARPVLFGALTSMASFAALLISDIPGIRQLAVFSIFGLAASLLLSLVVLPHFITPAPKSPPASLFRSRTGKQGGKKLLFSMWSLIILAGIWSAMHTDVSGDLRELGYVPEQIRVDEEKTRDIWGGMRETAIIFASGETLDRALNNNDRIWALLQEEAISEEAVSLAPILPGPIVQQANLDRWKTFWEDNRKQAEAGITAEGKNLGFSATAFVPFVSTLTSVPESVTPAALQDLGAGGLLDMLTVQEPERSMVLTLLPDSEKLARVITPEIQTESSSRLVSGSRFRIMLGAAMKRDVLTFGAAAFAAVAGLVLLLFRDLRRTGLALLPVGAGVTAVLTAMHLAGQNLNLFHIVSIPLVMGLGADYGIFMVCRPDSDRGHGTDRAVLVSGLTTLAGFGALTMARHPALFSIGLTVLTGIGAAMLTALVVIPRFKVEQK